jgi:hypothetical protein
LKMANVLMQAIYVTDESMCLKKVTIEDLYPKLWALLN